MPETKPTTLVVTEPPIKIAPKQARASGGGLFDFEPQSWKQLHWVCEQLLASGFLPKAIQRPAQAMAIILAGKDLGLSMMQSLRGLIVVEGKIAIAAEMQLALMLAGGVRHKWIEQTDQRAVLRLTREGYEPHEQVFTLEMAKRAGLIRNNRDGTPGNYSRHTEAMLRARCTSAAGRAYAPDILAGVYTPEEISGSDPAPFDTYTTDVPDRVEAGDYDESRTNVAEREAQEAARAYADSKTNPEARLDGPEKATAREDVPPTEPSVGLGGMTNGELAAEDATSELGELPFDDGPPEGPPADEPDPHSGFSPTDVRNAIESATSEAEATDAAKRGNPAWKGTDIGDMLRAAYDDKIAHLRKIAAAAPKTNSAAKPPDRHTSAQIAGEFDRRLTAAKTELSVTAIWEEVKASTIDTATKELLLDSRNQRLEIIRSDAAAPSPQNSEEKAKAKARAKEIAAMVTRFFADCEESLSSGHPAKAQAAKINSKRSANSGEISQADAARIGARADEVIATCGKDLKGKGKAK